MLRHARRPVSTLLQQCNLSAGLVSAQRHAHVLSRRAQSTAAAAESPAGLIITERCAQRIVQLNLKKGIEDPALRQMLRLSVEPGGCSGFSYKFELEETGGLDEEDDTVFEKDGAQVVVDESSLTLLAGSTVDYEDEMMKSAFVVTDNPQSAQGCGCGTSFSVEI